ncbi:hypothetical protein HJC23_012235 [Cyclotella cryptica]|uniref:Uncharacterized protein n=1 Tax=Cyclotella cryptica TaxID=29204 RepID=A0ABD3PN74_9STRA|eukprot:CCRYP_013172-RA/>CCRYP_013172-RA protein AED:0.28 eAED:0.28 QI:141/1/1/1/0.71/0.62/8/1778/1490
MDALTAARMKPGSDEDSPSKSSDVDVALDDNAGNADDDDDDDDGSSGSSDEESDEDEVEEDDDDRDADNAKDDQLSEYERMRLERIKRNNERLAALGLSQGDNIPQKPKRSTPKPRKKLSVDGPTRQLPGRAGRATFLESATKQREKKEREKEEEKNPDACFTCQSEAGELMCCDYCRKLYHPHCHPPISTSEGFRCTECESSGRKRRVACGLCSACKREHDCMTCAICVNNMNDGKMKAKCIFRRCLSWGKGVLERDKGKGRGDTDEVPDKHDSVCDKCKEGGDLICCDSCSRVFHSNCHKPKIYSLPEGEWTCMYCTKPRPSREKKPVQKRRYTDSLIAKLGVKCITVTVKWPSLHCHVCNGAEATGAYLNLEWTTCRTCHDSYHLKCLSPPLDNRPNKWRCPACREQRKTIPKETNAPKIKNDKLFEGVHDDDCYMCFNGGDLICCDFCSKVFHLECHIPPLHSIPKGLWKCCECAAVEYKRMMRCGECEACTRDDCGKCNFCKDKPKFGGPGRLKQTCELKKCHFMRLAPPASTPKKALSDKEIKEQFKRAKSASRSNQSQTNAANKKRKEPSTSHEDDLPKRKRGRPSNSKTMSVKTSPSTVVEDAREKGQDAVANSRSVASCNTRSSLAMTDTSLASDPVGSKIRTLISTALKQLDNPTVQKHTCQFLRVFITSGKCVDNIIQLGGLLMLAKAMYEHPNDVSVQVESNATLTKMVVTKQACGEAIIGSGCVALAIEAMESHENVMEIQETACALLRALSYDFSTHQLIMKAKGAEAVVATLNAHPKKLDSLIDGCFFLQNILCNIRTFIEASTLIISQGLLSVILGGLVLHPDVTYLRAACNILTALAMSDVARTVIGDDEDSSSKILSILDLDIDLDSKKSAIDALKLISVGNEKFASQFSENDGIPRVLDFMGHHPTDIYLVISCLGLMNALVENEQNSKLFVDANGFVTMSCQMNSHRTLSFIQARGCSILRRLVIDGVGTENAKCAIDAIFSALHRFDYDHLIQFDGRHALLNICSQYPSLAPLLHSFQTRQASHAGTDEESDTRSDASEENSETPFEQDHVIIDYTSSAKDDPVCHKIKSIINKATKHTDDHKVQDKACEQLRKFIEDDESAEKVIQMGAIEMIAAAMKGHPDKAIVQGEGCATLSDLIWKYPRCSRKIFEAGCLSLVVEALKVHTTHVKLQQMGCGLFRALSYENENHNFIKSVNGLEVLLDSMSHNAKRNVVVKEVCLFLQNMLSNPHCPPDHTSLIISKNAIPIIIDGMLVNFDADFAEAACGTIKNLAVDDKARCEIGKYELSIGTIISILESNVEFSASKSALDALKMLAADHGNRILMRQNEGIPKVMTFITNHAEDPELVETGLTLLLEFAKSNDQEMVLDPAVFEFVISEMKNHQNFASIQKAGCQIIGSMPFNNEEEARVALDLILASAFKNNYDDESVQLSGLSALLNVCACYPSVAPLLRTEENWAILRESKLKGESV